jgi:hypothetical protein
VVATGVVLEVVVKLVGAGVDVVQMQGVVDELDPAAAVVLQQDIS